MEPTPPDRSSPRTCCDHLGHRYQLEQRDHLGHQHGVDRSRIVGQCDHLGTDSIGQSNGSAIIWGTTSGMNAQNTVWKDQGPSNNTAKNQ